MNTRYAIASGTSSASRLARMVLCVSMVLFSTTLAGFAVADTVTLDLDYRHSTLQWQLYATVVDTGTGNNGDGGIAGVRAIVSNATLATTSFAPNIGATPFSMAFQLNASTLDILYGQNLSNPASIVDGVGVGGRWLIASGTYASATAPPRFVNDQLGDSSSGNFLNPTGPDTYGPVRAWNGTTLLSTNIAAGDYNSDGVVDAADYTVWRDTRGQASEAGIRYNGNATGGVTATDLTLWRTRFGATLPAGLAEGAPIPEPASLSLLALALSIGWWRRTR